MTQQNQILRILAVFALLALIVNAIGWYRFRRLSTEEQARFMTKGMGRYFHLDHHQKERLRVLNAELLRYRQRFPYKSPKALRRERRKWYKAQLKAILKHR
jgi:hypothetical protein